MYRYRYRYTHIYIYKYVPLALSLFIYIHLHFGWVVDEDLAPFGISAGVGAVVERVRSAHT